MRLDILPLQDGDLIIQYTNANGVKYKGIITGYDEENGVWEEWTNTKDK